MINIYSSDQSILINKTSDCAYDLKALTATGQALSLVKIDSPTVTLFGTGLQTSPLKASVKLSAQAGNSLVVNSDGLFVQTPVIPAVNYQTLTYNVGNGNLSISSGNTVNIPFQQLSFDCSTKLLQITGGAAVDLSCLSQSFVETSLTAIDTNSIDFTTTGTSNHTITANARIDSTQDNALSVNANGLFVAPPAAFSETPLSASDTATVDLVTSGTSNHSLSANVKISATAGNNITANLDGLYVPTPDVANTYTFQNGLNNSSNVVGLGGSLVNPTTILTGDNFLDISTTSAAGGFRLNSSAVDSYVALSNGTDNRTSLLSGVLTIPMLQGTSTAGTSLSASCTINNNAPIVHNSTNTVYAGMYGEYGLKTVSNAVTLGTGIAKTYSGLVGVFTVFSSGAVTGGMPAGGTFYSNLGGATTVQNLASIRTFGIIQTPNTTTYSGTVTNYYGIYLEPLDALGSVGTITNKFGIYQAGSNDVNRFFGVVQNAGGTSQFTSDIRVKENFANFTRGLEEVKKIVTHTYNYTYKKDTKVTGVVAQELEQVIPEAVSRGNFKTPEGVEYEDFRFVDQNVLFYTLVNAIKELNAKVELLEKKVNG